MIIILILLLSVLMNNRMSTQSLAPLAKKMPTTLLIVKKTVLHLEARKEKDLHI